MDWWGVTECGQCSVRSLRRKPPHIPHLCVDCLFPQLAGQPHAQGQAMSWREMLELLHRSASANHWRTPRGRG